MERFNFILLQTFHRGQRNSIFKRSVIEVGVQLQNLKVGFGFVLVPEN